MPPVAKQHFILSAVLEVVVCVLAPSLAQAQCPDPVERILTFPSDGAQAVPINAVPRVEYPRTQMPGGRPSWIVFFGAGSRLEGQATWDDGTTAFHPAAPLAPRTAYYARVTDESSGTFVEFTFATGTGEDRTPPSFDGIRSLSWRHVASETLLSECSLWRGDSFVLTLSLPLATDDGDGDGLCYYVSQTEGPGLDREQVVARVRRAAPDLSLLLSEEEGEGRVCYRASVRDLAGHLVSSRREACVDPIVNQVFYDACSVVAPHPSGPSASVAVLGALAALLALRRRPAVVSSRAARAARGGGSCPSRCAASRRRG